MRSASSTEVLAAARQWLRPLVHVLIRCGVTWKDFAELARTSYVDVATKQFGKRGRPTNVSRIAVLTGLTRRDVRKQRARLDVNTEIWAGHVTKASLVLSAWHQNPEFLERTASRRSCPSRAGERASRSCCERVAPETCAPRRC